MVTSRKKLDFWFWVKVVVIGFMLIFLIYPFCTLITRSFFSNKTAGFTFENYIRFFTKKYYYSALGRSLFVARQGRPLGLMNSIILTVRPMARRARPEKPQAPVRGPVFRLRRHSLRAIPT